MSDFVMNDALAFLSVIEEGSFAAAAKKCCLSPSVISKRIARLESHLHVQLLQRTTRAVALTEIGQIFYDKCKRIRADMADAVQDVAKQHHQPSGILRINAPMSFGQVHLVPAIAEFMKLNPKIRVELLLGSQFSSFIHNGIDLAIFIDDLPNTYLLKSRKIALRKTGIYGSPCYFEQNPIPMNPEDLVNHNCLVYQSSPGNPLGIGQKSEWTFYRNGQKIQIPIAGNLKINSSQSLVQAATLGLGLVKLSSFMVTNELKNKALISVLEEFTTRDIEIHAVYPNQRFLPQKVKILIDFLMFWFSTDD